MSRFIQTSTYIARNYLLLLAFILQLALPASVLAGPDYPALPTNLTVNSSQVQPVVGLRPFREGGIRLEVETVGGAAVVHNYGHGGAGLTLSWGTVYEMLSQSRDHLQKPGVNVVVVGGGVIGFTTAFELQKRGHRVTVYSDQFFPNNVSNIAGGLWSPVSVDLESSAAAEHARMKRIQVDSWRRYQELEKEGWPVRSMPMFVTEEARAKSGLDLFEALPELFQVTHHDRLPIEGVTQGGYEVNTILIDTPKYMANLKAKVEQNGALLVNRKFSSMEEIIDTVGSNSVIYNCTGLGARDLVNDTNVIPVRGDLLYIKAHPGFDPGSLGYMAFYGPDGTDYMFPRTGEAVVGGTFRKGESSLEVEPATCAKKLESLAVFFGALSG